MQSEQHCPEWDDQRKAEDLEPSVTELRRDSIHAIRDMLGVTRTTVELI